MHLFTGIELFLILTSLSGFGTFGFHEVTGQYLLPCLLSFFTDQIFQQEVSICQLKVILSFQLAISLNHQFISPWMTFFIYYSLIFLIIFWSSYHFLLFFQVSVHNLKLFSIVLCIACSSFLFNPQTFSLTF